LRCKRNSKYANAPSSGREQGKDEMGTTVFRRRPVPSAKNILDKRTAVQNNFTNLQFIQNQLNVLPSPLRIFLRQDLHVNESKNSRQSESAGTSDEFQQLPPPNNRVLQRNKLKMLPD